MFKIRSLKFLNEKKSIKIERDANYAWYFETFLYFQIFLFLKEYLKIIFLIENKNNDI